jgi:spermidine/putrescine transport system permease protein
MTKTSSGGDRWMTRALDFYVLLFFVYMFAPLVIMVAAAFNSNPSPSVTQWEGFTFQWFGELWNDRGYWLGMQNSLVIGIGVVLLSVPMGLAGALLLTRMQLKSGAKNLVYGILVSPILAPGILLGISTLVFWDRLGVGGGRLLAIFGQTSFVAAFCMLLFMARLQRFDAALEEAALDLGASHTQAFRRILLPFLRPSILTAAVIAFLQSLENYNTTMFSIGGERTLMIEIASNVRAGLTPKVNALAVILIALTVLLAIGYELKRRAEQARANTLAARARKAEAQALAALPPTQQGQAQAQAA